MCYPTGKCVVGDKGGAKMQIPHTSRLDDNTTPKNARHTCRKQAFSGGMCGFDFLLCNLLFFHLQPHVRGWNSSPSLTRGWHKVILSFLKWYEPNTRGPASSSPFLVFWNGLFISGKTMTYYLEGYSFLPLRGGERRRWGVKQSFCAPTLKLSHTTSFQSPKKLF